MRDVLVIDNIDSFVYNIVQYLGELGGDPRVITNEVDADEVEELSPELIVISPGPGRPENAGCAVEVIRRLYSEIPILGICLGHQAIAAALGGRVIAAKTLMHGKVSEIEHTGEGILSGVHNPLIATRYHSLAVDEASLPSSLKVTARTVNSDGEVMGIQHIRYPVYGLQFHPESILTPDGKEILSNFLKEGKK